MYAKLIDGRLVEAPYYYRKENKDIFGYNRAENANMMKTDGWKPVAETPRPEEMIAPVKSYVEEENKIVCVWKETYVKPVLTYAEKRAAEYPDIREYLDAQVKINSEDKELQVEGYAQFDKYVKDCLAVKAKYPKPGAEILKI